MWAKIGSALGLLAVLVPTVWYFASQDALAQATAEKTETLEEVVKTLKDIHVQQVTAKQAKKALKAKLCAEGKLKGADCI